MTDYAQVYQILDEYICGGELLETNKIRVLERMAIIDKLEEN